jgi:anti-sigma factor ChrR (cupin superfamily)
MDASGCRESEQIALYAVRALTPREIASVEVHLSGCAECRQELEALGPIVDSLAHWPIDVVRPSPSLWDRLGERIAGETGGEPLPQPIRQWVEPEWEVVAPGISCKVLSTDAERDRVSMLVRLEPGVEYPPHTHAGAEELHLLDGELWIDHRKLYPGDYYRAEPGTADQRVWSETGCTCVLITSPSDVLG